MENQVSDFLTEQKESVFQKNKFFNKHLHNNSFHGFWFDSGEKSYGIVLSFKQDDSSVLNLYAQDLDGQISVIKYLIKSDAFSIETIASDKVRITITDYESILLFPGIGDVRIPDIIEFTLQVLSHNSMYIQFIDYQMFTSPINKLRFGLVLARELKS